MGPKKTNPSIILNPAFIYISIWGLVLVLYSLRLTNQLIDIPFSGILMVSMGFISMFIAYGLSSVLIGNKRLEIYNEINVVKSFAKILLKIWIIGSIFDIFYSGGLPLEWVLKGDYSRNYTDFGIPSLHGVLNACYLQSIAIYFYIWLSNKDKKYLILILILLFWPVLMLGRGIFLGAIIQICAIYFMFNKIRLYTFIKIFLSIICIIYLFGFLGDIRNTPNPFDYLINDNYRDLFENIPSGFLWVYIYITSGINNIFYNMNIIDPSFVPNYSLSNLIPSTIKRWLNFDPRNDALIFADDNLNISTNYAGFISDFGPIGAIFCIYVIQQIASYIYIKARNGKLQYIFAYSVIFQVLIFSAFYDMFFLLPTLFQLFIAYLFYSYISKRSNKRTKFINYNN
jgi:oligosaccharide repeat unit polymerase